MANYTTHFFGAFVDVEVRPHDYELVVLQCANQHRTQHPWEWCPKCGQPITEQRIKQHRHPRDHYELLADDLADTLTDTTPAEMYGKGHIVLRANQGTETVWMEVDRYTYGQEMMAFPTDAEQEAMKSALMDLPAVQALQEHPQVVSVTIIAGYVEDQEY